MRDSETKRKGIFKLGNCRSPFRKRWIDKTNNS